jgi:elongator complex protein 2
MKGDRVLWHEIARPQIHGYDLRCVTFSDEHTLCTGADEKVLRVFEATSMFVQSLENISKIKSDNVRKQTILILS